MEGWQSTPVVNIFKLCDVESKKNVELSGKVALRMDEVIHKKVFRIVGSIPAVNFLKVPKDKPLGLTGRFLYLQVKFEAGAPLFAVHTELVTADGNTCRVSVGNIFKAENLKKKAGCVQLSLPDPPAGWALLCLDLQSAVAAGGAGVSPFKALKTIQLCSTITVRGAFSSDVRFGLQTLPREMVLSHTLDASQLQQLWVPAEPTDVPEPVHINKPILPKKKPTSNRRQVTPRPDTAAAAGSDQAPTTTTTAAAAAATKPGKSSNAISCSVDTGSLSRDVSGLTLSLTPEPSGTSSCRSRGSAAAAAAAARGKVAGAAAAAAAVALLPDPYMKLQQVNGFTGEYCRSVLYNPSTDELFFPAGSVVVALSAANSSSTGSAATAQGSPQQQRQQQRFFIGHSAFVSCLALGGQGTLLATGQEGKQPVIRLWDCSKSSEQEQQQEQGGAKCLAILCAHASNLCALDVSADGRALVACGADSLARQMIALWDIRDVQAGGQAQLLVKSVTSYHVRVLRFSPFELDHFVSAGRDNIRCYRMRGDEIRGISIKMQAPLAPSGLVVGGAAASIVTGPKVFTDIAFEAASSGLQLPTQHMYVATAAGAVFQVDYSRRCLTAVYQLHAAAINSLCVGEGLTLTASDDTTLRLWPLDFSAFLLEAQHEAPVTSACLGSADGLLLVAGCEDGSLGQLDVVSRQHKCLLRSHCGAVQSLATHPNRLEYITTSTDGSVRIWDATTHQQLFEFGKGTHSSSSSAGAGACRATCAAFSPVGYQLAVGFREGVVRLFDIATTKLLQERQQHLGPVTQLLFTPDGSRLLSCGEDGRVVVYATHHGCLPIKALTTPHPTAADPTAAAAAAAGKSGSKGRKAAGSSSSSKGRSVGSSVCAAVSSDGRWIAVGQAAGGGIDVSSSSSGGSNGGAALVLFDGGLEAVLQIESAARRFDRIEFSPDSSCIWALAVMDSPDSDTGACSDTAGSGGSSSSLLCFSVADGSLLQQLQRPHGASAVSSFCLDQQGCVLVSCGADHLVKLWPVGGSNASQQRQQQLDVLPPCQGFTAHHGTVTGAAFLNGQLITAGADGNICIWALMAAQDNSNSSTHCTDSMLGAVSAQQQQQQRSAGVSSGSAAAATLGSWLESRRAAGAAAGVAAGGVIVAQPQQVQVDAGLQPSPLFSEPVVQQQQQQQAAEQALMPSTPIAAARSMDPLLSCSAVLGLEASSCGVVWIRQAGALAYVAANTLILFDLATKRQSLLSHHRAPIGTLAVSSDALLIATSSAAAEPAGGYADVAVWDVARKCLVLLLQQHPVCVEQLAFSPDGAWLVSVGGDRVMVWDVAAGKAAAVGAVKQAVSGVAWLPHRPLPTFVTCGGDGLLLWALTPTFLEQRQLDIPDIALTVSAPAAAAGTGSCGGAGSGKGGAAGCRITAVCTAASSGSWAVDSLAGAPPAAAAAAGSGGDIGTPGDPVEQKQLREGAASNVFAADSTGGIWQLTIGEGRLCSCIKVTTLPPGETATALQWSQAAAALAVGTSSGRLLSFTCSSSSSSSGGSNVSKAAAVVSGVDEAVTPVQAATQWWAAAAAAGSSAAAAGVAWRECSSGRGGDSPGQQQQQGQGLLQLDGPVTRLCLEPYGLREGVVSTGAATAAVTTAAATAATAPGATAWYVDVQDQQKAPLLAGHTAAVTALVPASAADATPSLTDPSLTDSLSDTSQPIAAANDSSLVASLGQDGRLAIWQTAAASSTGSSSSGSRSVVSQVPVVEWVCPDSPATAAAFLHRSPACVLGHADGRISLLELNSEHSGMRDWGSGGGAGGDSVGQGGVLRWCVLRHPSAVIALALHPNQPLVMAASRDGLITTAHSDSGHLMSTCKDLTGTLTPLHDLAVNTSPTAVLAAAGATERVAARAVAEAAGAAVSGADPGSACVVATAWLDRLLVLRAPWKAAAGQVVCNYQCPQVSNSSLPTGVQSCVSFIPGSSSLLLFTSPCLGPSALLFDFTAGQPLRQLGLTGCPASLAVAPAGQLFAFGLTNGCVLLTDAAAEGSLELRACGGSALRAAAGGGVGEGAVVQAIAFAAGGKQVVAAVGGIMTVWDA